MLNCRRSRFSILLAAFFLLLASCSHPEAKTAVRYNLLLITLDTTRADHLGAWGDRSAETPALDSLAANGVRFDNVSSPVPLTLPAHCSLLSGLLPPRHGVRDNGYGTFPDNRDTLATVLNHAGYRTAAFVGAFVLDHRFGLGRGFDVYDDDIPRDPNSTSSFEAERRAGAVIERATAWIDQPDPRPFFAWIHLYDPHAPYQPPEPFKSRFRTSPYDGEIAYMDSEIGRLLADLDSRHLREHTIIAVVGDHGEALGEHGEMTHGLLLYEPTLHVPLIVSAPSLLERRVVKGSISSVDLAPTLAGLMSTPFPASSDRDGRDLSSVLLKNSDAPAADVYSETRYPAIFGWSPLTALRSGNVKLIAGPASELYDLRSDPGETRNVLSEQRRTWGQLAARLATLSGPAPAVAVPSAIDAETKAKLASLGYVAPGTVVQSTNADPKAMAPLFRLFEEATWDTNDDRLSDALPRLEKIVADDPANPVFRGSLARALRKAGRVTEAIHQYQEAVARQPSDPEAWYNLAVTLQEAGRAREAGVAVREALRRDARRPEAHNALGIALMGEGNVEGALAEFEQAVAIDPRDARGWNNIGNVQRARGDLTGAAASYQHAIAAAAAYPDPYNGLGVLAVQADHPDDALRYFDRAVAMAPDFYEARLNRAIALQILGRKDKARSELRELLARLPRRSEFDAQRKAATALLGNVR